MVRLATMNLTLRGLANVRVLLRNVLTTTLDNERKADLGLPPEGYHVVLANPPFSIVGRNVWGVDFWGRIRYSSGDATGTRE
jgi:type I restriction-modification system DNA methylase subunit